MDVTAPFGRNDVNCSLGTAGGRIQRADAGDVCFCGEAERDDPDDRGDVLYDTRGDVDGDGDGDDACDPSVDSDAVDAEDDNVGDR